MSTPWIFRQIKYHLSSGKFLAAPDFAERWQLIIDHCRLHVSDWGTEEPAIRSMRGRLMAYSKNLPEAKSLRDQFQRVCTVAEIEEIAHAHLAHIPASTEMVSAA